MRKIIVAIDGYSGCGKSTIAKQLATYAGYVYIDTGAMYRALAWKVREQYGTTYTPIQVLKVLRNSTIGFQRVDGTQEVCMDGVSVENHIRTLEIGQMASDIATFADVREYMVMLQRAMGKDKGVVMDGRDIGTVVFPEAELKLFVTASVEVRTQRRYRELQSKGVKDSMETVRKALEERDYNDTHRVVSPLRQAEDAIVVDNSDMTLDEQARYVYKLFDDACADR